MTERKRIKAKKRRADYVKKMKANKRLSGKYKVYPMKIKDKEISVRMIKRRTTLTAGDGILPKSRKYTKPKSK